MRARSIVLCLAAAAAVTGAVISTTRTGMLAAPEPPPVTGAAGTRAPTGAPDMAPAPAPSAAEPADVLAILASSSAGEEARRKAMFALVDALTNDPARAIPALERFLAGAGAKQRDTQLAVGALVVAGTPETQAALVRATRARADDAEFALLAMPSLGFLRKPTVETEAALRGFADGAAGPAAQQTARLSVGIMAGKLAAAEPARAEVIVGDYTSRLAAARTAGERIAYLDALGNAGTPAAAAAIASHLADPDAALRGRAVESLRLVRTPDAEAALRRALEDGDDRVRARAAWSLSYRTPAPETLRAMLARLASDPSERVGSAVLDAIWPRRAADPAAIEDAVRRAAGAHASQKVRDRARALLDGAA